MDLSDRLEETMKREASSVTGWRKPMKAKRTSKLKRGANERAKARSQQRVVRRITVEESHGGLPYLLTWQSVDGRPQQKYYGHIEAANSHRNWLRTLGRTPKVWADVTDSPNAALTRAGDNPN